MDALQKSRETVIQTFGAEKMDLQLFLQILRSHIDEYVGETPQFDDLTMLCVEYRGKK